MVEGEGRVWEAEVGQVRCGRVVEVKESNNNKVYASYNMVRAAPAREKR